MANVRTFRIHPEFGVPDREIREWLQTQEQEAYITVSHVLIPAFDKSDPRLTIIVTKLDDIHAQSTKTGGTD